MNNKEEKRKNRLEGLRRAAGGEGSVALSGTGKRPAAQPLAFLRPYRPVFMAIAVFMLGGILARRIGLSDNSYRLTEHLSESAILLTAADGQTESMDLSELSWYILRMEREVDEKARIYDPNDPTAYWKLRISNYEEASYIAEIAKKTVLEAAQRDLVYATAAKSAGARLDEEAKRSVFLEAERDWLGMSQREKDATGLTLEKLRAVEEQERLARMYVEYLAGEGTEGLEEGGSYYEKLCEEYGVRVDEDVTEPIRVGHVTVN
ncbi:MAG: hypothetical protein K6E50_07815 [Lachnospiraceae bacterium]|nr:hypothetical protein [Lachnospiraceae bacterium]